MEGESWGVSAAIRGHRRVCSLLLRSSGHHANGGHLLCNDGPSCSHGYAGRQQAPQAGLPSELRGATHRRDHWLGSGFPGEHHGRNHPELHLLWVDRLHVPWRLLKDGGELRLRLLRRYGGVCLTRRGYSLQPNKTATTTTKYTKNTKVHEMQDRFLCATWCISYLCVCRSITCFGLSCNDKALPDSRLGSSRSLRLLWGAPCLCVEHNPKSPKQTVYLILMSRSQGLR